MSLTAEGAIPFNAEEFTDPSELRALAELLGNDKNYYERDLKRNFTLPYVLKL